MARAALRTARKPRMDHGPADGLDLAPVAVERGVDQVQDLGGQRLVLGDDLGQNRYADVRILHLLKQLLIDDRQGWDIPL